jgi:predicted RNase H-related nuclease YkuK (DUF458 family)
MREAYLLAQQINQFYLDAFNHALVIVGIVFGVVGVVVPAGIAFFQARQAKSELEQLKSQISSEVSSAVSAALAAEKEEMLRAQAGALAAFQERSDKVVSDLREEIGVELAKTRGGAFHVQALAQTHAENHAAAVKSACAAIPHYVKGKDFDNLRTVCSRIAVPNLKKFNADGLGRYKDALTKTCEAAIEAMQASDHDGCMKDLVRDLRHEWDDCLARVTPNDDADESLPLGEQAVKKA